MHTTLNDTYIEKVKLALLAMQRYSWEQGVAAQAFLELGETDTVVLMAKEAVLRRREDGRLAVMGPNHAVTDPAANGEPLLFAARVTGDPALREAAAAMLAYLLRDAPKTADGTLHHITDKPQVWIDAMYMAPPFLAVAGQPAEAVKQIEGFRRLLWLPEKQLYAHIWDDGEQAFARKDCWGVGNGWTAAGITRVIRALPPEMADEKQRLIGYVREVIDGCLAHQRPDGLFHDVVDDPATFIETNLAQMLAYSIYRGVKGGWLDAAYLVHADTMRAAAHRKVDAFGLVQDVCGAPHFNSAGTAPEGQAFFLLMEAAYRDSL
ncbi:MAG TPA: glycoside hydrolase family 88 protein [Anaerolineae bacterium]|nr:glycoside hydrolase family 88 protein [Anaerolineae bacterium]HQI85521.1 glycoside hydrolase family 88 protein [Anaerolineae bacterium]